MEEYNEDEVKFFQGFQIDHQENTGLKRVYSLKFKTAEISEKWLEFKKRCENDKDKNFLKEWIHQYDSDLFSHLSFRNKYNYGLWPPDHDDYKDEDIIILYCEYVPDDVLNKINDCNDYMTKFNFKWNFEILKPIIADFVNYASNYTSNESISGKIEFVHTGEKVNVCYL